ncbi:hypothetical protein Tco_1079434 [Tanacetum coccineum]|uniref:Uncharacterized protein n=1 Tax=Tanacetum coccineum TaxID=301880 RepID=A0ABQ5HSP1_9ASTR
MPREPVLTRKVLSSDDRHDVDVLGSTKPSVRNYRSTTKHPLASISEWIPDEMGFPNKCLSRDESRSIFGICHEVDVDWLGSGITVFPNDDVSEVGYGAEHINNWFGISLLAKPNYFCILLTCYTMMYRRGMLIQW